MWLGKFYGDWKGLSESEISIVEVEELSDNDEIERESFDNIMGQQGENRPEEMTQQRAEPNSRRITRSSTRNEIDNNMPNMPNSTGSKVFREMKKLGAYYNPIASTIVQQTTNQSDEEKVNETADSDEIQ